MTATFDDGNVLAALDRLQAAFSDTMPLLRTIGVYGADSTQLRFQSQTSPAGSPWAALSPAYAEIKGPGRNILYESGALINSITYETGAGEVSWGSNRIYAAVHQFGATIIPKNAKALSFLLGNVGNIGLVPVFLVRVKSVTIPARPYLGISAEDHEEIELMAGDYLARAYSGI